MPKYEYEIFWEEGPALTLLLDEANALGNEGWEIIQVIPEEDGFTYLLKREKEETDESRD